METTPIKLRVLIYREGKFFLARCLENNLVAQALTFNDVQERFKALILAQVKIDNDKKRPLFKNRTAAAKVFFSIYESVSTSKIHIEGYDDLPENINTTLALSL